MTSKNAQSERAYNSALQLLPVNGRPCEVCRYHMHDHEWADLDENGFVVNCSIKEKANEIPRD